MWQDTPLLLVPSTLKQVLLFTILVIYILLVAQSDATLVRRLRELGAIIIGKLANF